VLSSDRGEAFTADFDAPVEEHAAATVLQVLEDEDLLWAVSRRAAQAARSWDERSNAARLLELIQGCV
jgi:hypothetical protein